MKRLVKELIRSKWEAEWSDYEEGNTVRSFYIVSGLCCHRVSGLVNRALISSLVMDVVFVGYCVRRC